MNWEQLKVAELNSEEMAAITGGCQAPTPLELQWAFGIIDPITDCDVCRELGC